MDHRQVIAALALFAAACGGAQPTATPTFFQPAGTYATAQSVEIVSATSNTQIYYTTDGSTPTTSSTLYSAPLQIATNTTLKAFATAAGHTQSAVATAVYVFITVSPAPAKVLTCDTLQFTGAPAGGTWSISSGAGSIDSAGLYSATAAGTATIAYALSGASATSTTTVATAFPGAAAAVPINGNLNSVPVYPQDNAFIGSNGHVYAAVIGPNNATTGVPTTVDT